MARLAGKTAFITGAGNGIGRAAALRFAQEGAKVVIADIDVMAAEAAAHAAGHGAIAIHTDVTEPDSIEGALAKAVQTFGRLDILYNNAGGAQGRDGTVVDVSLDEFWRTIKLDLYGTFLSCRFGLKHLMAGGGGAVVNTASAVALMGLPRLDCYTAAKGGVEALTRSLAVEYAPYKIRVNAVAPGVTLTERILRVSGGDVSNFDLAKKHLLGMVQPEDIAATALYLASDDARMVTGTLVPVDAGAAAT